MAANGLTLDDLQIKISVDINKATEGIENLVKRLRTLNNVGRNTAGLDHLISRLRDLGQESERLGEIADRIREITAALNATNRQFGIAQALGEIITEANNAQNAIGNVQEAAENANVAGRVWDISTAAGSYVSFLDRVGASFVKVGAFAKEAGKTIASWIGKAAHAPIGLLGRAIDNVSGKLKNLGGMVKRVAMYRMIRTAIKMVTQALKEGVQMLVEWDRTYGNNTSRAAQTTDEIAAKWREVKKSLGAAAMPLIQIFQPALMAVLNTVILVANTINQILRAFQGYSTYIKATEKGWKSSVGSAKELKNVLFGFDELNVLPSASGGGGGASVGGIDFEEVDIGSKLKFNVDELKAKFGGFFGEIKSHLDTFKQSIDEDGLTFSNFATLISNISGTIGKTIGNVFRGIGDIIHGFVIKFGLEGTDIGNLLEEVGGAFRNFGDFVEGLFTLDLPKIIGALQGIVGNIESIVNGLLGFLQGGINGFFDWLSEKTGLDLTELKHFVEGFMVVIRTIASIGLGGILGTIVGWIEEVIRFVGGLATNILRIANGIILFFEGVFTLDFEKILLGLEEIGKGAANIVLGAVELIVNGLLEPIRAVARAINNFKISIPDWIPLVGGKSWNPQVPVPGRITFERFASGGFIPNMPNVGSLFVAGESGAELVAHAPGGTEVLNSNQVEQAMANANAEVINAIFQMANMVVGAVNNKNLDVYLDTQKVGKSVSQYQLNYARAMGV